MRPKCVKRTVAVLTLALVLVSSGFADERGFVRALAEWQGLYRPLKTAKGQDLADALARVGRDFSVSHEDVYRQGARIVDNFSPRYDAAVEANTQAIEAGYAAADARGKRAFVRLAALLGNRFGDSEAPQYPGCGTQSFTVDTWARSALGRWVEASPAAYLGLLDDPDARVAEAMVNVLLDRYPDEVARRLEVWKNHRAVRFRSIAVVWWSLMDYEAGRAFLKRSLDDPSEDIRALAVAGMLPVDILEAYRLRRKGFERATWAQRSLILRIAERVNADDRASVAVACLEGKEASMLQRAFAILHYSVDHVVEVPLATLARLRTHPDWEVRGHAYDQSGRQGVPMRDLQVGMSDADWLVRSRAFRACAQGVDTPEELRVLVEYGLKSDDTFALPDAAQRLGEKAAEAILPLLESGDLVRRKLGVQLASRAYAPRLRGAMEKFLNDPDPDMRWTFAKQIVALPEPLARRWLQALADDSHIQVRIAAEVSLKALERR